MDDQHTHHHDHNPTENTGVNEVHTSNTRLAVSATLHCLLGCGIGEVAGMIISTWLLLDNISSVVLSIILGFIAGLILGTFPLIRRKISMRKALRIVIIGEGISIAVMELFEVMTQVMIPGVMDAHLNDPLFWTGMFLSMIAGFIAAFPVNLIMIRKGIRHH